MSDLYIGLFSNIFRKKIATQFSKNEGGGVQGRLEIFQNFISFGSLTRPLVGYIPSAPLGTQFSAK